MFVLQAAYINLIRSPYWHLESFKTRSEADPYFVRSQVVGLVRSYLGGTDPKNPTAPPLYGDLAGLPAIRVHVGDDEVLLDDSRRYDFHSEKIRPDQNLHV